MFTITGLRPRPTDSAPSLGLGLDMTHTLSLKTFFQNFSRTFSVPPALILMFEFSVQTLDVTSPVRVAVIVESDLQCHSSYFDNNTNLRFLSLCFYFQFKVCHIWFHTVPHFTD